MRNKEAEQLLYNLNGGNYKINFNKVRLIDTLIMILKSLDFSYYIKHQVILTGGLKTLYDNGILIKQK